MNLGVTITLNDLDPQAWNDLIDLARERQRIERKLMKARDQQAARRRGAQGPEVAKAMAQARKEQGIPAGGASIFPRTKPVR